jgi:hypothetical protein
MRKPHKCYDKNKNTKKWMKEIKILIAHHYFYVDPRESMNIRISLKITENFWSRLLDIKLISQ